MIKKRLFIATIIVLCLAVSLLSLSGCKGKGTDAENTPVGGYVTREEWLSMLADGFGLDAYQSDTPYYSDIEAGNDLFPAVQALTEWDILSIYSSDTLEAGKAVTYEEVASTAAIAAGFKADESGEFNIADSVAYAVDQGIVASGGELSRYMTPAECEAAVEAARYAYLHTPTEEKISVVFNERLIDLTDIPISTIWSRENVFLFSGSLAGEVTQDASGNSVASVNIGPEPVEIRIGDTFITEPTAAHPTGTAYKVTTIAEVDTGIVFITEAPTLADLYDELIVHTTVSASPDNIIWANGVSAAAAPANGLSSDTGAGRYHITPLSAQNDNAKAGRLSQDTDSDDWSWDFNFSDGNYEKTWKSKNSFVIGNGSGARALNASNFVYDKTPSIEDFNGSTNSWRIKLEAENKFSAGYKITGNVTINALTVTPDVEFEKVNFLFWELDTPIPESASIQITSDISATLKLEGNLDERLKIADVLIPIGSTGLTVNIELYLFVDASGSVQVQASLENSAKLEWAPLVDFKHTAESDVKTEAQMAIDINFGADLSAALNAFGAIDIMDVGVKVGGNLSAEAGVTGKCEVTVEDGTATERYTESMNIEAKLYVPVASIYTGSEDTLIGKLGAKGDWQIVGKDKGATCYTLIDEEWEFWSLTVVRDENGEIISSVTDTAGVDLPHTYTTKFGDVNMITYPPFSFDYPDGWTVLESPITLMQETVTLTNDRGVTVKYWHYGGSRDDAAAASRVDVSKIADADFVPGYVQATDYSGLGTFMVARITSLDDISISYALVPETYIGQRSVRQPYEAEFSFWYADYLSLIAQAPDGGFTAQEEKEVIAILSSFRTAPYY